MQGTHPKPQELKARGRRDRLRGLACVLAGLAATLSASALLWWQSTSALAERRQATADRLGAAVQGHLERAADLVEGLEVYFQASEHVKREEFAAFTRPLLRRHGQVQALEWIPRVSGQELAEHERRMREDRAPGYAVTESGPGGEMVPARPRDEHFPVAYVNPFTGNERARGFDLASSEPRLQAIRAAVARGRATATESIPLVQGEPGELGILILVPHWDGVRLEGLALGVFRLSDLLAAAVEASPGDQGRVALFESVDGALRALAAEPRPAEGLDRLVAWRTQLADEGRLLERTVAIGGRRWQLAIELPSPPLLSVASLAPWLALGAGLLLSSLVGAYFLQSARHAEGLQSLARVDPLTGVLNRRGLEDEVETLRHHPPLAVLLVNIDDFAELNRRYGHGVGDVVLEEIGQRIVEACPPTAAVGRLGGDEYLVLCGPLDSAGAHSLAERIRRRIAVDPVLAVPSPVHMTASLGLSLRGSEAGSLLQAVAEARTGLRESKRLGGNRAAFAPDGALGDTDAGAASEFLRDVCRTSTLGVVWEPLVRLHDEQRIGHELLIRGPQGDLESPSELFRAATEQGLLTQLDMRCLRTCIAAARDSTASGHLHFNLLPSTLLDVPAAQVLRELERLPDRYEPCIEVNEQQFLGHPKYLLEPVGALRAAGLRIAIDDVGSGRGTLDSVFVLQPDIVKIDVSLVRGSAQSEERRQRLGRLVKLCRSLGISMVAEGVESTADRDLVRGLGIETGQGYLWPGPGSTLLRAGP